MISEDLKSAKLQKLIDRGFHIQFVKDEDAEIRSSQFDADEGLVADEQIENATPQQAPNSGAATTPSPACGDAVTRIPIVLGAQSRPAVIAPVFFNNRSFQQAAPQPRQQPVEVDKSQPAAPAVAPQPERQLPVDNQSQPDALAGEDQVEHGADSDSSDDDYPLLPERSDKQKRKAITGSMGQGQRVKKKPKKHLEEAADGVPSQPKPKSAPPASKPKPTAKPKKVSPLPSPPSPPPSFFFPSPQASMGCRSGF